jgi:hypothetical protein
VTLAIATATVPTAADARCPGCVGEPPPYAPPGYVYYPAYGQQLPGPNCYWFRMPQPRHELELPMMRKIKIILAAGAALTAGLSDNAVARATAHSGWDSAVGVDTQSPPSRRRNQTRALRILVFGRLWIIFLAEYCAVPLSAVLLKSVARGGPGTNPVPEQGYRRGAVLR